MISNPLRMLAAGTVMYLGGVAALNITSSIAIGASRYAKELKMRKNALPLGVCRGKGFYIWKLCQGNATVKWSPLYDPITVNPVLCPTCDGFSAV